MDETRVVPPPAPMAGSLLEIAQAYAAGLSAVSALSVEGGVLRIGLRDLEPEGAPEVRRWWEAALLGRAVARQLAANVSTPGLTSAWVGVELRTDAPDPLLGTLQTVDPASPSVTPSVVELRASTRSEAEIAATVVSSIRALGLARPRVEWVRLGDLRALAVTAVARSPRLYLERVGDGVGPLFGRSVPRLLGIDVTLRDPAGAAFQQVAWIGEAPDGAGSAWVRDDLVDGFGGAPPDGRDLRSVTVEGWQGARRTWRAAATEPAEREGFALASQILGRRRHPELAQSVACARAQRVTLVYEDATLVYGPCRLPAPVQLAVSAARRADRLATCERPSQTVATAHGRAVALGPFRILGVGEGASLLTRPNGRVTVPVVATREPRRRLRVHAWSCAGDVGGYVYLYPRWTPRDGSDPPPGLAPADVRMLTGRLRTSGLLRLYLDDPDGRFHGTAVLRIVRPGRP
ncbi:MAG: hypothetical protein R3C15_05160 [Thermoleophilia bacterium]